jgi:hypothetical protein
MKKYYSKKLFFIALFILGTLSIFWLDACKAPYQPPERFFDSAESLSDEIRLTILYPSLVTIKKLIELRDQGLITIENLTVIGVYHENERTDYQRSFEFVRDNNLRWFKFHKISEELNKNNLFGQNPCSGEFKTKRYSISLMGSSFSGEKISLPTSMGRKRIFSLTYPPATVTSWKSPSFFIFSEDSRTKTTRLS